MGLDMWEFVEVKHGDKWEYVKVDLDYGRIYAFYAAIAGVRNYPEYNFTPISRNRGYPDDLSDYVRDKSTPDDYGCGDLSPGWVTLKEMIDYDWPTDRLKNFFNEVLLPRLSPLGNPENVRLVFWFS